MPKASHTRQQYRRVPSRVLAGQAPPPRTTLLGMIPGLPTKNLHLPFPSILSQRQIQLSQTYLCLDAFIVVLIQESDEGVKLWCKSTRELQRVSLGFCTARRDIRPPLVVNVERETPRSLWSSVVTSQTRVPFTRAASLTLEYGTSSLAKIRVDL